MDHMNHTTFASLLATATTFIGAVAGWLMREYQHRHQVAGIFRQLADLLDRLPGSPVTQAVASAALADAPEGAVLDAGKVIGALAAATPSAISSGTPSNAG